MKHADCGGTLVRQRSQGVFMCDKCRERLFVGVNATAHIVDDRLKPGITPGDAPHKWMEGTRANDWTNRSRY